MCFTHDTLRCQVKFTHPMVYTDGAVVKAPQCHGCGLDFRLVVWYVDAETAQFDVQALARQAQHFCGR